MISPQLALGAFMAATAVVGTAQQMYDASCDQVRYALDRLKNIHGKYGEGGPMTSEARDVCLDGKVFRETENVDAFLWLNHGYFMASPGTVMALGGGDTPPSLLIRCLGWNETRGQASTSPPSRIDALVVNSDDSNQQLETVLQQAVPIDVVVLSSSAQMAPRTLVGAGYRELSRAGSARFSVLTRPGFLLGIEREMGIGNVIPMASSGDSGSMCSVFTPRLQVVFPRAHNANSGTGCTLTECTRHFSNPDVEGAVSGAFAVPQCLSWLGGGKKYALRWEDPANASSRAVATMHFTYPVRHLDVTNPARADSPICKTSDGRIGTLLVPTAGSSESDGRLRCVASTSGGREVHEQFHRLLMDVTWPTVALNSIASGELPLERDQSASTAALAARILSLFDTHLDPEDRQLVARASGHSFRAVIDAVGVSTRSELAGFLSNKKWSRHHGNSRGMHLARALLAERMLDFRRKALGAADARLNPASNPDVAIFETNGFVVLNMLATHSNENAKNERRRGPLKGTGGISAAMHSRILAILQYAAGDKDVVQKGWRFKPVRVVASTHDIQTKLHSDSFASTIKVFAFAQPVAIADGPFNYVNSSHRHSEEKLRILQKLVINNEFWACQSPRLYENMQQQHGIDPWPLEVPANTMVIADTNGFHRRGAASPGTRRDYSTIYFPGLTWSRRDVPRLNPFRPVGEG